MSPPQQYEKAQFEPVLLDQQLNLKELAATGNYLQFPDKKV